MLVSLSAQTAHPDSNQHETEETDDRNSLGWETVNMLDDSPLDTRIPDPFPLLTGEELKVFDSSVFSMQ